MWLPNKYHYNNLNSKIMSAELKINKTSNVVMMSSCPKDHENRCGIMWRMP